ncbi:MAG: receptor ligand binding family protein, partial [Halothece sp. Uz-M2-17]|nr:receptor ligand binding family protein [Halothece sp. Uz-M2-17]
LQVGGEDAVGMAIPIPWHIQKPGSQAFVEKSRQLWGADVNWATVMAYDAMNAIAQAIEQNPSREGIQNALSSSGFSAQGVVQPVKFLPSGDRDGRLMMVEVQPANPSRSGTGYDFVPIN